MGRIVDFLTGRVAPEPEPTAASTALPTAPPTAPATASPTASPTAQPTAGSTSPPTAEPTAPIYVIRDAGVAVDLAGQDVEIEHPLKHAAELLRTLMRDEAFAGQPATEKPLRKLYTAICRSQGIKPFPWPSVLRHVNGMLKAVYGPAYKKTYKRVYEDGRLRNRRVYRIPLLEEAARTLEAQDVAQVA
jgi:hypothetical protein